MDPQMENKPIDQPVNNPMEQTSINQTPKDSHGITIAAMAIFVLLALGAVAFLYYQNQQLKGMLASYQTPTSTPTPIATPTPDVTINWKTYNDPKKIFSFRYPDNLTYKTSSNAVVTFNDNQGNKVFSLNGFNMFSVTDYQNYLSDRQKNGGFVDQKTFVDTQGRSWQTDMILGQVFNFTGILNFQNKYYVVSLQSGFDALTDNGSSFRNLADQIISTIQFLSPTSSPSATPAITY